MTVDLKAIFTEWQNNPKFRQAYQVDPKQALEQAGFIVSETDLAKIKTMIPIDDANNDQLDERINR